MTTTLGHPVNRASIDPEAVAAFGKQLGGNIIRPGDDDYDAARRLWNGMIDKRPS